MPGHDRQTKHFGFVLGTNYSWVRLYTFLMEIKTTRAIKKKDFFFCHVTICTENCDLYHIYLSDKYSEEQQCEVPGEEQEGGTEPQVIKEVQQSSNTVDRVDGAGDGGKETYGTISENHFMTMHLNGVHHKSCNCMNNSCTGLFECRFHVLQNHALGICPVNLEMQHFINMLPLCE